MQEDFKGQLRERQISSPFMPHWPHPVAKKARRNSPAMHSEERENQCDETTVSGIYSVSQVIPTTILNVNCCIHFTNEKTEVQRRNK